MNLLKRFLAVDHPAGRIEYGKDSRDPGDPAYVGVWRDRRIYTERTNAQENQTFYQLI